MAIMFWYSFASQRRGSALPSMRCVSQGLEMSRHSRRFVCLRVQVLLSVFSGQMPAIPADMPAEYRALLERCWANKADARPTFAEIGALLQRMLAAARQAPPNSAPPQPISVRASGEPAESFLLGALPALE